MSQKIIFIVLTLMVLLSHAVKSSDDVKIKAEGGVNPAFMERNGFSAEDFLGDDRVTKARVQILKAAERNFGRDDGVGNSVDPEVDLNAEGIVRRWGYPSERHLVETEDGYLLNVFRIPHGKNSSRPSPNRPAVFLQHGLLCSSTNWITNLPNESLAYILADAGFDVWMGNMRGNTYSRRHTSLSPDSAAFWAFSWDEMTKYDLPAMIEFVVNATKQPKIFYVGHSQGTLIMFAAASSNPALASRIRHFFALGPVSTVGHLNSWPIRFMSYFQNIIEDVFRIFGVKEFLPNDEIMEWLARGLCNWQTRIFCSDLLFVIAGYDPQQLNSTRLPVYISHTPAGTSVQNMVHFAQMVRSNKFQMYDYGSAKENIRHYKQATPPVYDISAVKVNTSLYWGGKDLLADPTDVKEQIVDKMQTIMDNVYIDYMDHLDFLWGLDVAKTVYKNILARMLQVVASSET